MPATRSFRLALAILLIATLALRLYRLSDPPRFYFDEVYHAFTGERILAGDRGVYDPWAKAPPGVAYEWAHPPLGKLLIAGTMAVAGESSFGWRLGSVIAGTASVALTAWLGLELFAAPATALFGAFFFAVEGLSFSLSRIAMGEAYFVFFALLTLLLYARARRRESAPFFLAAATTLGLAFATKWTAVYLGAFLGLDLLFHPRLSPRRKIAGLALLALLPALLYVLAYAQLFFLGGQWADFLELQHQMWAYHTGLHAEHGYQSRPLAWVLNLRPIWMGQLPAEPGYVANIYAFGNSVVLLAGLAAVGWHFFRHRLREWPSRFLLLAYFMLWLPWVLAPRIMFFYHYAPAVPLLCLLLARALTPARPALRYGVAAAALLWFAVSFPHLTGIAVPEGFANAVYFALPGWK